MQSNTHRHVEWRKLIEEQKESGLNKAAFCKEKGLAVEKFYYYADTLTKPKKQNLNKEPVFVPIEIKPSARVNTVAKPAYIRIILRNGIECILSEEFNVRPIKDLIEVLQKC
ncbi:MAG: hypothetical protein V4629_00665 [Pseudomonadota bacterium]